MEGLLISTLGLNESRITERREIPKDYAGGSSEDGRAQDRPTAVSCVIRT